MQDLERYFFDNREGLVAIKDRNLELPPNAAKEYRNLGCMESNIFSIIGNRMKGRRACWSLEGGNNLARLLCLKMTDKLSERLRAISSVCIPEKYAEEQIITLSAAKVLSRIGKGYNEFNREIAKYILGSLSLKVEEAKNGAEAIDKIINAGYFDLVLMDIQMPVTDRYTATKEIRKLSHSKKAGTPIIAMTVNAFSEDRKRCFAAGMNGHIAKPIEMNALIKELSKIFG